MKITPYNTTKAKAKADSYLWSGYIDKVQNYTAKDGSEMVIVFAYDPKTSTTHRFSNYKSVFDSLVTSTMLEQIEEGDPVDIEYTVYTSEKTGRKFENFQDLHFPDFEQEEFEIGSKEGL